MTCSLVTGAGGFVGANLVRALNKKGDKVYACVRPGGEFCRLESIKRDINIKEVDITSAKDVERIVKLAKPNHVYHLAHYGGNRGQLDGKIIRQVLIEGTANLYQACLNTDSVESIIHTGSSSEYGAKKKPMAEDMLAEPNTEYGISKLWATLYGEHLRREKGAPISTMRLFGVYGPFEASIRFFPAVIICLLTGRAPQLSNPKTARDFIYIDDVIEALILAAQKPFGVYNVGTGFNQTLEKAYNLISQKIGNNIKPNWGGYKAQTFDSDKWVADMTKTHKVFNWQARHSLKQGIEKTITWIEENIYQYEKD